MYRRKFFLILFATLTMIFFQNCSGHDQLIKANLEKADNFAKESTCYFNGIPLANGFAVTAYKTSTVNADEQCVSETRLCSGGGLTGSYNYSSCVPERASACLFNGKTILHNQSIIAYQKSSVSNGSTCVSQSRICSNGILSGAYSYSSCSVNQKSSCLFDGKTIAHSTAIQAYKYSSVGFSETCISESRICDNGALSGSFTFGSCVVGQPKSCLFDGKTVLHDTSVKAFKSSSVAFGLACESEDRACKDGVLSGSYIFSSCQVGTAQACIFNDATIVHGADVVAYKTNSVSSSNNCESEKRLCNNGKLSGSFGYSFCAKQASSETTTVNPNVASCGLANLGFYKNTPPASDLCLSGNSSFVTSNGYVFKWTCTVVATNSVQDCTAADIDFNGFSGQYKSLSGGCIIGMNNKAYCPNDTATGDSFYKVSDDDFVTIANGSTMLRGGCGITTAGNIKCWGQDNNGFLGNGVTSNKTVTLLEEAQLAQTGVPIYKTVLITDNQKYKSIAIATPHYSACGVTATGDLKCWGHNVSGILGTNDNACYSKTDFKRFVSATPKLVGTGYSKVYSSGLGSSSGFCAIKTDGTSYCWGDNSYGLLAIGESRANSVFDNSCGAEGRDRMDKWYSKVPLKTNLNSTSEFIPRKVQYLVQTALDQNGYAYVWGVNGSSTLGLGNSTAAADTNACLQGLEIMYKCKRAVATPTLLTNIKFKKVVAYAYEACGLTQAGAVYCWGFYNSQTQAFSAITLVATEPLEDIYIAPGSSAAFYGISKSKKLINLIP